MNTTADGKWKLEGQDVFDMDDDDRGFYPLEGEYDTEELAKAAARIRLKELEGTQPSAGSGGQSDNGIQDRVYIVRPDGSKHRFVG